MTITVKQKNDAEWIRTHTLSPEQLQKLLEEKMKRAIHMHQIVKRENLQQVR